MNPASSSDPAVLNARTEYSVALFDQQGSYLGTQHHSMPNWQGHAPVLVAVIDGVARDFVLLGARMEARLLVYVET